MNEADYLKRISELERENRILKQKLDRSIANRVQLEEILETHSNALKTRNAELEESRELLKKSEARYRFLANHDPLTHLPNRAFFQEELSQAMSRTKRLATLMALLFIDLDQFKTVNDNFGHETGDILLSETAIRFYTCLQSSDTVARLGGDEFAIILESLHECSIVDNVCKRIIRELSKPFTILGNTCFISASIGISVYPLDDIDPAELLQKADYAMYTVKKSGANNYMYYHDIEK